MKRLGSRPVVEYLISVQPRTRRNSPERRKTALAALEGRVDKNNVADIERIFVIAKDENTPDDVRDLAFARLGETTERASRAAPLHALSGHEMEGPVGGGLQGPPDHHAKTDPRVHEPSAGQRRPADGHERAALAYGPLSAKMEVPRSEPKVARCRHGLPLAPQVGPKLAARLFYQGKKADLGIVAEQASATRRCSPSATRTRGATGSAR